MEVSRNSYIHAYIKKTIVEGSRLPLNLRVYILKNNNQIKSEFSLHCSQKTVWKKEEQRGLRCFQAPNAMTS